MVEALKKTPTAPVAKPKQPATEHQQLKSVATFIVCETVEACKDFTDFNQAYGELVCAYEGKPSSLPEDTINRLKIQRGLLGNQSGIGLLAIEAGVFGSFQTSPAHKLDLIALEIARAKRDFTAMVQIALTPKVFIRERGIDGEYIALRKVIEEIPPLPQTPIA